jgi:hypothetical protein
MIVINGTKIINIEKSMSFYYIYSKIENLYYITVNINSEETFELFFDTKIELDLIIDKFKANGFIFNCFDFFHLNEKMSIGFNHNKDFLICLFKNPKNKNFNIQYNSCSLNKSIVMKRIDAESLVKEIELKNDKNIEILKLKDQILVIPRTNAFYYHTNFIQKKWVFILELVSKITKQNMIVSFENEEDTNDLINLLKNKFPVINIGRFSEAMGFHYSENNNFSIEAITKKKTHLIYENFNKKINVPFEDISEEINNKVLLNKIREF